MLATFWFFKQARVTGHIFVIFRQNIQSLQFNTFANKTEIVFVFVEKKS